MTSFETWNQAYENYCKAFAQAKVCSTWVDSHSKQKLATEEWTVNEANKLVATLNNLKDIETLLSGDELKLAQAYKLSRAGKEFDILTAGDNSKYVNSINCNTLTDGPSVNDESEEAITRMLSLEETTLYGLANGGAQ
jgi:hypothetical protein